jgi:hypothetical protein
MSFAPCQRTSPLPEQDAPCKVQVNRGVETEEGPGYLRKRPPAFGSFCDSAETPKRTAFSNLDSGGLPETRYTTTRIIPAELTRG